jgi:hypothetical protein
MRLKSERTRFDRGILDWQNTRNSSQTAAIVKQILLELGENPTAYRKAMICKKYGIYPLSPLFGSLVDPYMQTFPCVGHCIDLGILLRLVDAMLDEVRSSEHKISIFEARVAAFFDGDPPRGWTRITINLITVKGKKQRPMHTVRKVALMSPQLFDGLVSPQLLMLTKGLLSLRSLIMNPKHTAQSILETQNAGQLWIELAKKFAATHAGLKIDLPNLHLIIELLLRSLPVIWDMRLALTSRYEAMHAWHKRLVSAVSHSCGAVPENYALHMSMFSQGLQFFFAGGRSGPNLSESIGSGFDVDFKPSAVNGWKPSKWLTNINPRLMPARVRLRWGDVLLV